MQRRRAARTFSGRQKSGSCTAARLLFLLETRLVFASVLQTLAATAKRDASGRPYASTDAACEPISIRIKSTRPTAASLEDVRPQEERAGPSLLHCAHKSERAHASQMSDDAAATTPPKQQEERTSCWLELDALYSCATPKHQFEVVYRDGTFDDCQQRARGHVGLHARRRGAAAGRGGGRGRGYREGGAARLGAEGAARVDGRGPDRGDAGAGALVDDQWSPRRWWSSRGAS